MELKQLGNTGVTVPEIGLGAWNYTGGVEPLRRGVDLGAFLIDTAEVYGTEEAVGRAIDGIRDRVFVATKVSGAHLREKDVKRAAEQSLRRLGVDVIDLYQVHWPSWEAPISETMRAMEGLADAGMVRYIGVSNFGVGELREAQAVMRNHPIVANQVLYSLKEREIERGLLSYCAEQQITVIAYTPLADGELARRAGPGASRGMQALESVAAEVDKTLAQVALNWCTARSNVIAIPKSNSAARTEENCGASGWRLSAEQVRVLEEAFPL